MNARVKRRLGIAAAAALAVAALPSVFGQAGADEPVAVPAGTTLEREIAIDMPTVAPAEVVLLFDATGSEYRSLGPAVDRIVGAAETAGAPLRIAVASVGDYPVRPFGVPGDAPYTLLQPLSADPSAWTGVLSTLEAGRVGGDPAEAQIGALAEAIQDEAIGFSRDATKLAIVISDAPAHDGDDVGCDDNGACIAYPGPMATDVGDLASANGVRLASLGDVHADALRAIAPPIGAADDQQDPLVSLFLPKQLSVTPETTCDGDVTVAYEPATVTGLPGATVTVRQTISAGVDETGSVTCSGAPVQGLDLVVDTAPLTFTETDLLTDPAEEPAPPADEPEDPTATVEEPAPEEPAPEADAGDEEAVPVEPVVATVTIAIENAPFLIDISLAEDTQEALLEHGAVVTETPGELPETGFGDDLTAELTEEPLGGVVVPDPDEPLAWEYQPVGPGNDSLVYTLTDADGVVVATITLVFEVIEPGTEESEAEGGDSDGDPGEEAEEPPADPDGELPNDEAPPADGEQPDESDPGDESPAEPDDEAEASDPAPEDSAEGAEESSGDATEEPSADAGDAGSEDEEAEAGADTTEEPAAPDSEASAESATTSEADTGDAD